MPPCLYVCMCECTCVSVEGWGGGVRACVRVFGRKGSPCILFQLLR